jgi:serine protease AprX
MPVDIADAPFDPSNLEHSIIALPLLQMMEEDLQVIGQLKKYRPDLLEKYNAAIEYVVQPPAKSRKKSKPDGEVWRAAYEEIKAIARDAAKKAEAAFYNRIMQFKFEGRTEEDVQLERDRENAFRQAMSPEVFAIEEPQELDGRYYSFARLHAAVIRRINWAKKRADAQARLRNGRPSPIARIVPDRFDIIIDLNLEHPGGRQAARKWVYDSIEEAKKTGSQLPLDQVRDDGQEIYKDKSRQSNQYVFARLEARVIKRLVELDIAHASIEADRISAKLAPTASNVRTDTPAYRAIFHIWPDFPVAPCITQSVATVKADAAQIAFSAHGADVVWAVADSGINRHEHFLRHGNLDVTPGWHRNFNADGGDPLNDEFGHGTHVAGIIAGEWRAKADTPRDELPVAISRYRKADSKQPEFERTPIDHITGMAPECKLVSLKVLDENGEGSASNLIAAITHIQEINGYGRRVLIHGLNLSLGYSFEPEWFACGQSPLCVEVNRLVKSGVSVVVAAGNTGYGNLRTKFAGPGAAGLALTINDPGNADLAITVGSTHRDQPHTYGVSYFSSKGPTGDGRLKPDLVAPGEKIISCASPGSTLVVNGSPEGETPHYIEDSGTSMAAPHVSGSIAAFLSIRREFREHPEKVKEILVATATDLHRDRYFQGAGLIDLMRAIQSV